MSTNNSEYMVAIPTDQWPALRNVYRQNWPKDAYTYFMLNNYINWARRDPELCKREVRILSVDNDWSEHGIYILEDKSDYFHVVHVDICSHAEDMARLQLALSYVDTTPYTELLFRDKSCKIVKKHLEHLGYIINLKTCYPSKYYHLHQDDCLRLEVRSRNDFIMKPLNVTDAKYIDDAWKYKSAGSLYTIVRNIKYNLSWALMNQTLVNYALGCELGTIAFLHVKDNFRRRGLAEDLVRSMCHKLAEQGCDATAHIEDTNEASTKLFRKLGFQPREYNYWFIKADYDA
ncbi:unnamed protein product [Ceratitis capitata]|uniref:(Mediterranean fruit fly) hypothetical protein n=1 Tax=Ceratitis capitata TaxID=7213 RepID=A0A811UHI4_CERCA|nr:unnamed protein product [Ceratitis capitata]